MTTYKDEVGGWVYILASKPRGTLYTDSTTDLVRRVWEHRSGVVPGFTRKYAVTRLVWFEPYPYVGAAAIRERAIKRWRGEWKFNLVEKINPAWDDLWPSIADV